MLQSPQFSPGYHDLLQSGSRESLRRDPGNLSGVLESGARAPHPSDTSAVVIALRRGGRHVPLLGRMNWGATLWPILALLYASGCGAYLPSGTAYVTASGECGPALAAGGGASPVAAGNRAAGPAARCMTLNAALVDPDVGYLIVMEDLTMYQADWLHGCGRRAPPERLAPGTCRAHSSLHLHPSIPTHHWRLAPSSPPLLHHHSNGSATQVNYSAIVTGVTPTTTIDFNFISSGILIGANQNITFRDITLRNLRRGAGLAVDFFTGDSAWRHPSARGGGAAHEAASPVPQSCRCQLPAP